MFNNKFIPLSVPSLKGNEWEYIKECLDTEWVSSAGKYVDKFEQEICNFTGAKYAVACMNGTSALQVALRLVGVDLGDEVIVPTVTFIAPVNVVRYLGAEPIFMDCDAFLNIDIEKTLQFIKEETEYRSGFSINRKTGKKIKAIIPVHMYGNAVDFENLILICAERNIKIVEDATESLGTYYTEGKLAVRHSGTIGQIGCYSFNGNKIITTGGGGMIVTDDGVYADRARYLTTQAKDDEVRYIHNEVGYNFRLTNLQAAMGVAQLEQLPDFIKIKHRNYALYKAEVDKIAGLHLMESPNYAFNNHWMHPLLVQPDEYGKGREELMQYLLKHKIQTRPLWYLNHLQRPYQDCQVYQIEKSFNLWESMLNLPCSVNLDEQDIYRVIEVLKR